MTAPVIYLYLQSRLPSDCGVPNLNTIQRILREHFHLSFKSASPAMVRYLDPTYNEKRLWVSRLLAQFLLEDVTIISIDESNLRSDCFKRRKWCFNPKLGTINQLLNGT